MATNTIVFLVIGLVPLYYCFEDYQEFGLKRINAYRDCHNAQYNVSFPAVRLNEKLIEQAEFCATDQLRNEEVGAGFQGDKRYEINLCRGSGIYGRSNEDISYLTNRDYKDPTKIISSVLDDWYSLGCDAYRNTSKSKELSEKDREIRIIRFRLIVNQYCLEFGIEALEKNTRVIVAAIFSYSSLDDPGYPQVSCCSADHIDSIMGVSAARYLLYLNPILFGVAIATHSLLGLFSLN